MSLFINGVEALINAKVGGTWSILSGTWTIPAVTLNGDITGGGHVFNLGFTSKIQFAGPYDYMWADSDNGYKFCTSDVGAVAIERFRITGGVGVAVAAWLNGTTQSGVKLTGAANAFGGIVLATGTGKSVDNVITALQNLGLVTQT